MARFTATAHRWAERTALSPRWFLSIAFTALVMFAAKTTMAALTFGTNDITTFEQDLKKLDADGWQALYRDGVDSVAISGKSYHSVQVMSHPPFMLHVLPFWRGLARITRLPFQFWVRFSCALADVGSLWLLCLYRAGSRGFPFHPAALLVFAASPILLMISGFHGNTDPIMIFLVLFSVYTVEIRKQPVLGGAILGLAIAVKLPAVIFAAAVLLFNPDARTRLRCFWAMLGAVLVTALPFVFQNPLLIVRQLSSYGGQPGVWGWSILAHPFYHSVKYNWFLDAFASHSKLILLLMLALLSIAMNWRPHHSRAQSKPWPLLAQCGLLAFFFIFFTPGFAVQYLTWLTPWIVVLGASAAALYHLAAGAFIFTVYTEWCRGLPWYYANSFEQDESSRSGFALGLACWFLTGIIMLLLADSWLKWRADEQASAKRAARSDGVLANSAPLNERLTSVR